MNKGRRGDKREVERRWRATGRANFDRQERAIERRVRQQSKKIVLRALNEARPR